MSGKRLNTSPEQLANLTAPRFVRRDPARKADHFTVTDAEDLDANELYRGLHHTHQGRGPLLVIHDGATNQVTTIDPPQPGHEDCIIRAYDGHGTNHAAVRVPLDVLAGWVYLISQARKSGGVQEGADE